MAIKFSIQGLLIYAAIVAYLIAFLTQISRPRKTANWFFIAGFVLSAGAFIYRWLHVAHIPLQNLFELFIAMGACVYILSYLTEKLLSINQRAVDMLIGASIFFPAGFIFSEAPQQLPPALQSPLFIPHVGAYALGYIFIFKAAIAAIQTLGANQKNSIVYEQNTYCLIRTGFPLMAAGLMLGSIWAQFAWADYFGWDPKELWSLATVLVYIGYFHWRFMFKQRFPRINGLCAIAGFGEFFEAFCGIAFLRHIRFNVIRRIQL
jgi:ABC-type transport system involved in cytochrome c biogenesis permease subunit